MDKEQIKNFIHAVGGYSDFKFAPYGIFQISWIILAVICCIFAFKLCYKKHLQRYHLSCGIIMTTTLFYRILILTFKDGTFNLNLKNLPFTAFDVSAFTILLSGIFTKGKLHVILSSFNSAFGFLLGAFVLLLPQDATFPFLGVSVQIKLNALLSLIIATINLKCFAKTFKVFDFLMSASVFIGLFAIIEGIEMLLNSVQNVEFLCFFAPYFSIKTAFFSHLLKAFPHALASFIVALLFAELSAGVYYLAYRLSTRKRRYK